jgi:hypothetical protein
LEAFGFLLIYLCFVTVVLIDKYIVTVFHSKQQESERFFQQNTMYQTLPLYQYSSGSESSYADLEEYPTLMETPPMTPTTYEVFQIPSKSLIGSSSSSVVSRASSTDLSDTNGPLAQPRLYRKSSAPTPRSRAENVRSLSYLVLRMLLSYVICGIFFVVFFFSGLFWSRKSWTT